MDLTPYLETLRRELSSAASIGDEPARRAGEMLAGTLDASARLCLMEALADAADEVTSKLDSTSVEVRLRGREADLVVTELAASPELAPAPPATGSGPTGPAAGTGADDSGEVARITLRLPEGLKEAVERAASAEGISVNAWLVRAIAGAVDGRSPGAPGAPFPPGRASLGRRVTGYAQA